MSQRYVEKRGANHGLHIVLTILTCGIWAITGWPIATAMGRKTVTTVPTGPPPQQWVGPGGAHMGYAPPPSSGYPKPYLGQQPYQAPPYYGPQPPPQPPQQPPPGQYGPPPGQYPPQQ